MNIAPITGIPNTYLPQASQVPPFVRTPEQLRRWCACFALSRRVLGFDSPYAARELYHSPIPTDPPAQKDENPGKTEVSAPEPT